MPSLLSLLLACSVHLDDPLLLAVAEAFSGGNPFVVRNVVVVDLDDEMLGLDEPPTTRQQAEAALVRVARAGGAPVAGLLPLRPEWAHDLGKPLAAVFDPCQAVEIASAKMSEFDYACRDRGKAVQAPKRRACTLDKYGTSLGLPALGRFILVSLAHPPAPAPPAEIGPSGMDASLLQPGGIFFDGSAP